MRHLLFLPVIAVAAVLWGCSGTSNYLPPVPTTPVVPLTYTVGGTIAGLNGTVVLQNNGSDSLALSTNGPFSFDIALQPSAAYHITVATQPANETCTVTNGSGKATGTVTNIKVDCGLGAGAINAWTWVAGGDYVNAPGVYGTKGTPAANVTPGARRQPVSWTDASGNLWLFGGNSAGNVGMLNDLWEYSPTSGLWVWQGGVNGVGAPAVYGTLGAAAAGNNPGAREGAARWTDAAGKLWLFGGDSLNGQTWQQLSDLWSYDPGTALWTWVGGVNTANGTGTYGTLGVAAAGNLPPARTNAVTWVDSAGVFWLFGGATLQPNGSYLAVLNDLWSYNPTTGLWTWVGGSNAPDAPGVYGTQGLSATGNVPPARMGSSVWLDGTGNVWLFGGLGLDPHGFAQEYNDLWEYSPTGGQWTWVGGSSKPNVPGAYGTLGTGAAGTLPGARTAALAWKDHSGNFWLFGGYGYAQGGGVGTLNDLWKYDLTAGVWTWTGGTSATNGSGIYGALGNPAPNNVPGAREQAAGWLDGNGNFWLFGGFGFDPSGVEADLNDLWRYTPGP